MRLRPGTLNRRVTIEQPTYSISGNTNNKYISDWVTYKNCFAGLVHKQSQEAFESGQMVAKDTFEWKCWFNDVPDIKMDMRIKYNSEYYYIVGIKELGYKEAWLITSIRRDNGTE